MKNYLIAGLIALTLSTGCITSTKYGTCIGIDDQGQKNLQYKMSAWNVFLGIFFLETVIVPIYVAVDDIRCPVGPAAQ